MSQRDGDLSVRLAVAFDEFPDAVADVLDRVRHK